MCNSYIIKKGSSVVLSSNVFPVRENVEKVKHGTDYSES
jgi:hypothetical protein